MKIKIEGTKLNGIHLRIIGALNKRVRIFVLLTAFSIASAFAQKEFREHKNDAFKPGESLTYRVHYGFIDAGEAKLEVLSEMKSFGTRPCYHVVGTGKSVGAFDWFFKVRDRYESFVDSAAIMPWFFIRRVDEGGYKINQTVTFNHYKNIVTSEKSTLNMPDYLQDLVSAFYYARTTDFNTLKIGDVLPIDAWLDDALIPLNVKFVGREKLNTKFGKINCIVLRPLLQQGRVFKENEDLTLWVSDDQNKIPIRAEAKILVGSVKMDLKNFSGLAVPLAKADD
ncbi:MAG: DUF3108 domain-containing protein [Bacteroidia bacterium]